MRPSRFFIEMIAAVLLAVGLAAAVILPATFNAAAQAQKVLSVCAVTDRQLQKQLEAVSESLKTRAFELKKVRDFR